MSYHYSKAEGEYGDSYDMQHTGPGYRDDPHGYNGSGGNQYPMSAPAASAGSPYTYQQPRKKRSKWLWIGIPILLIVIILAAVLGGVLGSRHHGSSTSNDDSSDSAASTGSVGATGTNSAAGVGSTNTGANGNQEVILAISTDSYMLPVYPTGTATSGYIAPTTVPTSTAAAAWPTDPSPPSTSAIRDHPRLIAPQYKWDALNSGLIEKDPYLKSWNTTIVNNATSSLSDPPEAYVEDGGLSGSGVLDVARRIKLKVKNWAYAYRITNNTQYADRVWEELQTAAGNNSNVPFGTDDSRWNPAHFLDLAEFCAAFAIGYDWLYDFWSDTQKEQLMWSIINMGLSYGQAALSGDSSASSYLWWTGNPNEVNGNWNCVCNGGLTLAALAIMGDDQTGIAQDVLSKTVPNAKANCMLGVHDDGTWSETPNYWYFGTTGAAEMISSLITAYGDDQGLLETNSAWNLTSLYHIYVQGMTSLFNYGDHGPNKYSTTANSLMLWSSIYNEPRYALYQRDHYDASEPWSMFWYDPALEGTWWDGLALDAYFDNYDDNWASMRSTWSSNDGTYIAMKSGNLQGHQTHGDLDIGDFVIDALGQRWAGELGSGQYLSPNYFEDEDQDSPRWLYYNKRSEGQNTILLNYANQVVTANATQNYGSTGEAQGAAPSYTVPSGSTAFYTADMSPAYNGTSMKRGIRFINNRQQILLQDDVSGAAGDVMWRMHTNATVSYTDSTNTTAVLSLGGETLQAKIISGPEGAAFSTMQPVPMPEDPALPGNGTFWANDMLYPDNPPEPGVTVLVIDIANGGTFSLQVLFNPQYPGASSSSYVTPPNITISEWTTTSHNN